MSTLKDLTKTSPFHRRRLEFNIYEVSHKQILLEGWLKDDRFVETHTVFGKVTPPGKVHRICVRMLLGGWPLEILDAEAEMPHIPHDECLATQETVNKIIGLKISHGYTNNVRKLLGGVKGCTHMVHLIISMGNAALQGYWTQMRQTSNEDMDVKKRFSGADFVINSCFFWRENGPQAKKVKDIFNKIGKPLADI